MAWQHTICETDLGEENLWSDDYFFFSPVHVKAWWFLFCCSLIIIHFSFTGMLYSPPEMGRQQNFGDIAMLSFRYRMSINFLASDTKAKESRHAIYERYLLFLAVIAELNNILTHFLD